LARHCIHCAKLEVVMQLRQQSVVDGCEVRPVRSKSDMRRFKQLPRRLCVRNTVEVQPLKMIQDAVLDRKRHPFYDQGRGATAEFFLAVDKDTGRPVGRIAAILDHRLNQHALEGDPNRELHGHFGFFDCVNSLPSARALIKAAADWLRERGVRRMFGPASPSQSYDYGLLVKGHDSPHRFLQPYHAAYYASLLEGCGLSKSKDFLSLTGDLQDPGCRKPLEQLIEQTDAMRARPSFQVTVRPINMRRFREETRVLGDVLNEVLRNYFGHSPITEQEWRAIVDSLRPFVNPDFVLLAERRGKPIGLTVAVPDLNEVVQRLRLRAGPLELVEFLLRAWRWRPQCVCIIMAGATRDGGRFAVTPIMLGQLCRNLMAHGVRYIDAHQILEDNHKILDPVLRHGLQPDRIHRVYQLEL
jgi:hypothetical protein